MSARALRAGGVCELRRGVEDIAGAHEVTFSGYRGRARLSCERTRPWVTDALAAAWQKHTLELWAYAIMREHGVETKSSG